MTLDVLRNQFEARYVFESKRRKQEPEHINDGMIALFMSEAIGEVENELGILKYSEDISVTAGTDEYTLSSDYGQFDQVKFVVGTNEPIWLEPVTKEKIDAYNSLSGTTTKFSIYPTGNDYKIKIYPSSSSDGTLTVYYRPHFNLYEPNGTQTWGTFDGTDFSTTLKLPDKYALPVVYHMLTQVFPDMYDKYYSVLMSKKTTVSTNKTKINWRLNGVP